ncbi:coiled-coil domain-containing protein 55-domain containing protein [Dendryphion nanum]|uniref:Coiled-coil domain-containing protein 55-domain containing protein n=1 Tax=Dendryphion nanum TaxID=256645 RepID=A0A9P9D9W6_9PLEO|nr:coiled-coil domain-containing protein 55-domain containing protein [Dendryphion nanum]
MSFKFGLNSKIKLNNSLNKPAPAKRKPVLGDDEPDSKPDATATNNAQEIAEFNFDDTSKVIEEPSKPKTNTRTKGQPPVAPTRKLKAKRDDPSSFINSASAQESERRAKEALEVDTAIYDYDAAYDALHARTAAKKAAEKEDAQQGRPKYMESLFASAEQREKDRLQARDKVLKRERETEGDEFADKEKFVTGAYKAQQEEIRKAEEEEKKRQELEDEKRRKSGMSGFHKKMLMEEEKRHQEAEAAMKEAAQLIKEGKTVIQDEPKEKTDAEIARELNEQGKNVMLNEDGEVVDKRQLLKAGLNVVAKPKSATTSSTSLQQRGPQPVYQGRNASKQALRQRQTAMVAEQIEAAAKRKADEEAEEQAKILHASKSQKTSTEISSAKERYLQRKREAAAAKAAASGKS